MDYKVQLSNINKDTILKGITKDSINYLLYNLFLNTNFNFITFIVNNNFELELSKKEIDFYSKEIEIIKFPEWNTIPYDVNSPNLKIQTERLESIYKLINYETLYKNKKVLLIVSKNSVSQKIINKEDFKFINLCVGQKILMSEIENILKVNSYENVETAFTLGNYSVNNNTIDIITFENKSYRIFIKNNYISEIKSFNPNTQISFNSFDNILILPIKEVIFSQENIQNFKQNYRNSFGIPKEKDELYNNISNGISYNGFENWLPLFYNKELNSIFDLIPNNSVISYNLQIKNRILDYTNQIFKYYDLRNEDNKCKENKLIYNPVKTNSFYLNFNEFEGHIKKYLNIVFEFNENENIKERQMELNFKNVPNFFKESKEVFMSLQEYL